MTFKHWLAVPTSDVDDKRKFIRYTARISNGAYATIYNCLHSQTKMKERTKKQKSFLTASMESLLTNTALEVSENVVLLTIKIALKFCRNVF